MSDTNPESFEAIIADIDMDLPSELTGDVIGRSGWNNFVQDFKERQRQMEGFGQNGVVGSEDLKKFQRRFNELDPNCVVGERRFGYVDLMFDAFVVTRIDGSGRPSTELKSLRTNAQSERIRAAQCSTYLFEYESPAGESARLLSLKVIDIDSSDAEWFDEYLQDPSSGIYIPAANLLEKSIT